MNLILFEPAELEDTLPVSDPRVQHVFTVLRRTEGAEFDAGLTNGTPGKAALHPAPGGFAIRFRPLPPLPPRPSTRLLVGFPRPQTARDVLRDATTLGATEIEFVRTARSDPNYAASTLWRTGEWRRHVLAGAMQAFDPRLPEVRWDRTLAEALEARNEEEALYALDNYEPAGPWANRAVAPTRPVLLALGPERGWDAADRDQLRGHGAALVDLGPRILRTETAVIAALTLLLANRERG